MDVQLMAGSLSSIIFVLGTLNMLAKAWRMKDMRSYSGMMLILNNVGNLIYWVYVLSLPMGPIYVLHGFNTIATLFMLVWWMMYRVQPQAIKRMTQQMAKVVTGEFQSVMAGSAIEQSTLQTQPVA